LMGCCSCFLMVQFGEVVPVFTGTVFISVMGVNQKG